MTSIALFTEGITDQIIIESLILNFLKINKYQNIDDVDVNPIQPERDATDENKQVGFGGWEKVFEYCENREIMQAAIAANDFILIQIDTDCAEHPNYGVALTTEGKDKVVSSLVNDVVNKIESLISNDLLENHRYKFIFAVSVHSLECWILHFLGGPVNKSKLSCEDKLRKKLEKQNELYNKDAKCYSKLKDSIKKKDIKFYTEGDESMCIFIKKISEIFEISLPSK